MKVNNGKAGKTVNSGKGGRLGHASLLVRAGALLILLVGPGACEEELGGLGEHCRCYGECGLFNNAYQCNQGLVCNTAPGLALVCQLPHTVALGGPCGADDNCAADLFCFELVCHGRRAVNESCGGPLDCDEGLACQKRCGNAAACAAIISPPPCPDDLPPVDAGADGARDARNDNANDIDSENENDAERDVAQDQAQDERTTRRSTGGPPAPSRPNRRRPAGRFCYDPPVVLFDELTGVLAALDNARIDYALVGGLAVAVWGAPRATKDIDLLVRAADLPGAMAAVRAQGFTLEGLPFQFKDGTHLQRVNRVDAAGNLMTVDFMLVDANLEAAWQSRVRLPLGDGEVSVISRDALIGMKARAARPQDIMDILSLKDLDR